MRCDDLISIIVPIYNTKEYLSKCVESICNQTYRNIEIILVDDGSNDGSSVVCDNFAKQDSRIKVLHIKNSGQSVARNTALEISNGKYIGFVDSDDFILEDMYEKMYNELSENDADICICSRYNIFGDTKTEVFCLENKKTMSKKEAIKNFLTYKCVDSSPCDKLFKKEIIKDIRFSKGYICEDMLFVFNALLRSNLIIHIGTPKYCYLQRIGSTSKSFAGEKNKGLLIYPTKIEKLVNDTFPDLRKEAEYFRIYNVTTYIKISLAYSNGLKDSLVKELCKNELVKIIFNKNIKMYDKIIVLLIRLNLYEIIKNIHKKKKEAR